MTEPGEAATQEQRRVDDRVVGLLQIAGAISSELDFPILLKRLAQTAARICGADRCTFYLVRDDTLVPAMSQYASGQHDVGLWRRFQTFAPLSLADFPGFARALDEEAPVVFTDPAGVLPEHWIETFHIRSGLILPLVRGQRRVGLMHLNNSESARSFAADDVELAQAIGVQLALVIDNARLVEETRSRLRDTETLLSVGQTINSTLDLVEVVRRLARAVANALRADSASVLLVSEDGAALEPLAGYHVPKHVLGSMRGVRLPLDGFDRIGNDMSHGGQSLWSDDVPNDPRFTHDVFRRLPLQSVLITRVEAKTELVGVLICSWYQERRRLTEQELHLAGAIAAQAAIAIVNARLYAKAEELAVNRERVRVAHELHDRLSQSVFSLGLRLEWCLHQLPSRSPVYPKLQEVWEEARSIMSQMRDLIYRLSAESTAETELSARLRKLVAEFEELSGTAVAYEERGDLARLGGGHEDVLFKILQEGFANIVKHAKATGVSLSVEVRDETVVFELVDDGVGPPPHGAADGRGEGHHGLRMMVERIESAGGQVEFGAATPSGFAVRGALPLRAEP